MIGVTHRFLLFSGEDYEERGGMLDLRRTDSDVDSLIQIAKSMPDREADWWHIFDRETGTIVAADESRCQDCFSIRGNNPEPYCDSCLLTRLRKALSGVATFTRGRGDETAVEIQSWLSEKTPWVFSAETGTRADSESPPRNTSTDRAAG
jgi:hypothetical protein